MFINAPSPRVLITGNQMFLWSKSFIITCLAVGDAECIMGKIPSVKRGSIQIFRKRHPTSRQQMLLEHICCQDSETGGQMALRPQGGAHGGPGCLLTAFTLGTCSHMSQRRTQHKTCRLSQ